MFREEILLPLVTGMDVLDCGGIDHTFTDEKREKNEWLHAKIASVASRCVGVDILESEVRRINEAGNFHFVSENAETCHFLKSSMLLLLASS